MSLGPAERLLSAWAAGRASARACRPLALLEQALGVDREELAGWPLGRRDRALLDLLAETFGDAVEATVACSACGEAMEVSFSVDAVRAPIAGADPVAAGEGIDVRAPTTADVAGALAASGDADSFVRTLAALCAGETGPLEDSELTAVAGALEGLDPQADLRLEVDCPACAEQGEVGFDVADYMWRLVEARVRELIADVDALAHAYGWSEADVLALPPERRELYLELVGA
jgi:hypothetical protein